MEKTASSLKKSLGISSSLGLVGVGMTMPKSSAFPSDLGWTVKDSTFYSGFHVMNTFCDGCTMYLSFVLKLQHVARAGLAAVIRMRPTRANVRVISSSLPRLTTRDDTAHFLSFRRLRGRPGLADSPLRARLGGGPAGQRKSVRFAEENTFPSRRGCT